MKLTPILPRYQTALVVLHTAQPLNILRVRRAALDHCHSSQHTALEPFQTAQSDVPSIMQGCARPGKCELRGPLMSTMEIERVRKSNVKFASMPHSRCDLLHYKHKTHSLDCKLRVSKCLSAVALDCCNHNATLEIRHIVTVIQHIMWGCQKNLYITFNRQFSAFSFFLNLIVFPCFGIMCIMHLFMLLSK